MQKNEHAQELAYQWVRWLNSRRFLAPPIPPSMLALLGQDRGTGEEPDGPMASEMPAFNAGVMALISQKPDLAFPFLKVYCGVPRGPVKTMAGNKGISPKTYYELAHKGAGDVVRRMNMVINLGLMTQCVTEKSEKIRKYG